jgi:hypothetical protein
MCTSTLQSSTRPPRTRRTWKGPRDIPANLTHLIDAPRFVLWRYGSIPNSRGKYKKLPFSPHKGVDGKYHGASDTDPATWGTWADCLAAADTWRGWFDGIGIVLFDGDVGIDLDDGVSQAHVDELIACATGRAYIDRSVSGKGWHIIVLGALAASLKTDTIEVYAGGTGRYFALGDERPESARPAAAQDVIDRAVTLAGARAQSMPCPVETIALTPELAADLRDAQAHLDTLLAELPANLTAQFADLLYRGVFPPALKDTSDSGARAVVVAQLHRAPKRRYSDAEIYVLAREIWRRKGWEGAMHGKEKALAGDCWRLLASYRPGAPPKPTKRTYQEAPDPLVYLARLADEAVCGVVLLTRDERAALLGCSRPTAQRTEQTLIDSGLIELFTYALNGDGVKGRRGALRFTPAGHQAIARNESVILSETPAPAANDQVTPSAPVCAKPPIVSSKNTLVGDSAPAGAARSQPRVPSPAPAGASDDAIRASIAAHFAHEAAQPRPHSAHEGQARFVGRDQQLKASYRHRKRYGTAPPPSPYRPPVRVEIVDLPDFGPSVVELKDITTTAPQAPQPSPVVEPVPDAAAMIARLKARLEAAYV